MSTFKVLITIEFISGGEITFFFFMVNNLHIYQAERLGSKVVTDAEEFFGKKGDIEIIRVIPGYIATLEKFENLGSEFLKSFAIGDIGIGNTGNCGSFGRYRDSRVNTVAST